MFGIQLEFDFGSSTASIAPPCCGRELGPCRIVITDGPSAIARCAVCGCYAPGNRPRTIFDGFIEAQLSFFEFLHQQESRRTDSGNRD